MSGSEDSRPGSTHVMAPHRWRSARILEAVYQVNEHVVNALSELAKHGSISCPIVGQNVDALRRLDATACSRVARIPVLLVDLHFQCDVWWRVVTRPNGEYRANTPASSCLPATSAAELAREALIVAWLAVQHAPQNMSLLFGMSDAVAKLLGDLTPQQLNGVAERAGHELRIRWQTKPDFWMRLLAAGQSGNSSDLCEARLLGLQLLGGELMRVR
jgi:hypothetical protein